MDKLLFKRILIGCLTALIAIYVIYLFVSANFNVIHTENATQMTATDKIYANGFIVRDEDYITNDNNGYVAYSLNDGDEVSTKGTVAKIYPNSSDAVLQQKIEKLNTEINQLTELTKSYYSKDIGLDTVNNQLNNQFTDFLSSLNKGNISSSDSNLNSLLYSINERQLITRQVTDFSSKISSLEAEVQSLNTQSHSSLGDIYSPKAGYFVSVTDGYEKSISFSDVKDTTADQLKNVASQTVGDSVIGKVVSGLNWYVVCPVNAEQALNLSFFINEEGVTIEMPFASTESIPATVVSVNQADNNSDGVVVFKCNYMNTDIADARNENIEIGMKSYTGLRVSTQCLHDDYVTKTSEDDSGNTVTDKERVQGVYVLHGNELKFKQVSILYSGSDYVICNPTPDDGVLFNGETVQLYDKVVTEGDNLYDGKIVR